MEKQIFQAPSEIEKVETRKDNTIKLTVGVQEIARDEEAMLMRLRNKSGWFMFSELPVEKADLGDIPDHIPLPTGKKSPNQREAAIMFVYWDQMTDKKVDFNAWRDQIIEKRIVGWQQKLNE